MTVPKGLLVTQVKVARLMKYVNNTFNPIEARLEGYLLLREFYYIAFDTLPEHHDDAMAMILEHKEYNPEALPAGIEE